MPLPSANNDPFVKGTVMKARLLGFGDDECFGDDELKRYRKGLDREMPFPPAIIKGFSMIESVFTSGDLARAATGSDPINNVQRSGEVQPQKDDRVRHH